LTQAELGQKDRVEIIIKLAHFKVGFFIARADAWADRGVEI